MDQTRITLSPEVLNIMMAIIFCVPIVIGIAVIHFRKDLKNQEKEVNEIKQSRESFHRESLDMLEELESVTK